MKSIYIVIITTESMDRYVWPYSYIPSREELIKRLYEHEGAATLEWYDYTTSVKISKEDVK